MTTFSSTTSQWALAPAATAAPTSPPISACEELDGRPKYHVVRFQAIAPISPAITITRRMRAVARTDRVGDGVGDLLPQEGADEVHHRRHEERDPSGSGLGWRPT